MKVKLLMLLCLLVVGLVVVGCAPTKAPAAKAPAGYESIRLLGSTIGSETTVTVMAYAVLFSRHYPEIEWSGVSGATGTNPIYLTKGTAKLAMFLPSNYIDAYGFDKVPESRLRSIHMPRPPVHYLFIVPEDKPWKDITDVPKGTNLSPGSPGTTRPVAAEAWLRLAGLSKKDFNWIPLGWTESADAWRAGKIDLLFITASSLVPALMDIQTSPRKFKPMGLSPEQAARAKAEQTFERLGFTAPSKGTLSQLVPELFREDVLCTTGPNFLSSRDDFPEEMAYKMARILDEQYADLVRIYPATKHAARPEHHIQWARPPQGIHPGVAKYYREKGYLK